MWYRGPVNGNIFSKWNTLVHAGSDDDSYGSRIYRSMSMSVFPDPDGEGEQEVANDTAINHCSSAQLAFIEAVVRSCSTI